VTQLDSYALIAWLTEARCAGEVDELIRAETSIAAVNLAEVVDRMARLHAADISFELEVLAGTVLDVVPIDMPLAFSAGELRARHHREPDDIGIGECIAVATALDQGVPLATADPALAEMMRAEGGAVVALPDSRGNRPTG
jgi:PIN domain nuclease of toxin-antitoxin system